MNLFTQNIAEVKISYSHKVKFSQMTKLCSSNDAYKIMQAVYNEDCQIDLREYFYVLLLNRANKCIGVSQISSGGMTGTVADPKLIFQTALKSCAASIILCHNHPSGNTNPSPADLALTQKIKSACGYLDINMMDHIIITSENYLSFADDGLLD